METGVTAHRLDLEYDTGAMLGQLRLAIDPSWNSWTLAKKLDRPSLSLLRSTALAFASGSPPRETPQVESLATLAPAPDDDLLELDWSMPVAAILRRIRAASPSPGAFTFLGDTAVTITRADLATDFPRVLHPGEAAVVDGRAVVRAGDGAVVLLEALVEADESASDGSETRVWGAHELAEHIALSSPASA